MMTPFSRSSHVGGRIRDPQLSRQRTRDLIGLAPSKNLVHNLASAPLTQLATTVRTRIAQTVVTDPGNCEFPQLIRVEALEI